MAVIKYQSQGLVLLVSSSTEAVIPKKDELVLLNGKVYTITKIVHEPESLERCMGRNVVVHVIHVHLEEDY